MDKKDKRFARKIIVGVLAIMGFIIYIAPGTESSDVLSFYVMVGLGLYFIVMIEAADDDVIEHHSVYKKWDEQDYEVEDDDEEEEEDEDEDEVEVRVPK